MLVDLVYPLLVISKEKNTAKYGSLVFGIIHCLGRTSWGVKDTDPMNCLQLCSALMIMLGYECKYIKMYHIFFLSKIIQITCVCEHLSSTGSS